MEITTKWKKQTPYNRTIWTIEVFADGVPVASQVVFAGDTQTMGDLDPSVNSFEEFAKRMYPEGRS